MKDATKRMSHRPSKRELSVSDGEESTSDQPVAKNVKRKEESLPSPEVIELQQKLHQMRLEGEFQRSCRERENQIMIDLEKKLAEVSLRLEEAKGGAEDSHAAELAQENEKLKKEMAEMRMEYQMSVDDLTTELAQAYDNQKKDRARNEQLARRLHLYDGLLLPMQLDRVKEKGWDQKIRHPHKKTPKFSPNLVLPDIDRTLRYWPPPYDDSQPQFLLDATAAAEEDGGNKRRHEEVTVEMKKKEKGGGIDAEKAEYRRGLRKELAEIEEKLRQRREEMASSLISKLKI